MPSQEERLSIVEQSVAILRTDLLQAISDNTRNMSALNRALVQQEQNLRDADHEITILVGVVGRQGQDIKSIKEDLSIVKSDLSVVKTTVESHEKRFDSLDEKLDQLLLMVSKSTSGPQQE